MRWSSVRLLSRAGLFLVPALAACGKDGGTTPQPTEFTLTMAPATITLKQSETGLVNAAATITSGPGTEFTFAVEGVPAGVTITPPPAPSLAPSGGTATGTLAIVVSPTAAPGVYSITAKARSKAGLEKSATFTLTVTLPPSYTIAATPATQAVNQSGTGGAVITLTRTNFTAPVLLSIEDNPPGVVGTFSPSTVTGNSSALSLTVGPTVVLGTYTIRIRASSAGMVDRTATIAVTVTAEPNFSLTLKPAVLNVISGGSATDSVLVNRTNYTDGISFAFESVFPGITGVFNPGATTGASTVLTVSVASTVTAGTYALTVRGTGPGVGDRTATLNLTVALPAPSYTLSATPVALSVESGQSGTSTVALARTNFTGAVALSLDAPPAGITGAFVPASTTTNSSQLTVNVASTVAPGVYALTVKGTAAGLADRTTAITLTVTAPPSTISLTASPESLFVFQGAQASATLNVTRFNFPGDVTLAATGAPAGMTISFGSNPITGNSTSMAVAAAGTVAAGRYLLTLSASGTGVTTATRSFAVNVTGAGSGSQRFTFCDPARTPVFFAYQDSAGVWTPVTPVTAGVVTKYFFDIVSDRGGVAFITKRTVTTPRIASSLSLRRNRLLQATAILQKRDALRVAGANGQSFARPLALAGTADVYDTFVYYLAKAEMNTLGQDLCGSVLNTKENLANVAGVGAGQFATMSLGGITQSFVGGVTASPVTFTGVPERSVDLVGTRYSVSEGFEKGIVLRNLNVANRAMVPTTVDFDGLNAFVPAVAQATINNSLAHQLSLNSLFFTANGEAGLFGLDATPSTVATRIWSGVPASKFLSTDLHGLFAIATPASGGPNDFRSLLQYVGPVANQTVSLGAEMDLIAIVPVGVFGDPRYRVSAQTIPLGLRNAVEVFLNLPIPTGNSYRLLATGAYLTNSGVLAGFDLTMPSLSALTGFPAASRLTAGTNDVRVSALGWTGTGITAPRPQVGDQLRIGARGATVVVP